MSFNKIKKIKINPKIKTYLPSKMFLNVAGGVIALVLIVFFINYFMGGSEKFSNKNKLSSKNNELVSDLLQTDTDGDGVFDWEEALWGTDKNKKATFNETPDNIYIKNKKESLNITEGTDSKSLNETDAFAREFFASYVALQSNGSSDEAIKNFSKQVGEKIGNPELVDKYSKADLKILTVSGENTAKDYYRDIQEIFDKYRDSGMGEEVNIVNESLINEKKPTAKSTLSQLTDIGNAYKNFAEEISKISVPSEYAELALKVINAAHNTGVAVISMTKVSEDPIVGLSSLSQYKKYSEELSTNAGKLEENLISALE